MTFEIMDLVNQQEKVFIGNYSEFETKIGTLHSEFLLKTQSTPCHINVKKPKKINNNSTSNQQSSIYVCRKSRVV